MSKDCRINLRFSENQLEDIRLRAKLEGLPTATFVRKLILKDIARDHDAVVKRLGRMIIYSSFSMGKLYNLLRYEGELYDVDQKVEKLMEELLQHED